MFDKFLISSTAGVGRDTMNISLNAKQKVQISEFLIESLRGFLEWTGLRLIACYDRDG